mgnify:CR=1 FL=1
MSKINDLLPTWDKENFLAYAMMYAAYADNQLRDEEYEAIKDKVGVE